MDADRQDAVMAVAGQDWSVGHDAIAGHVDADRHDGEVTVARQEVDALVDHSTLLEVRIFLLGRYPSDVY